MRRVSQKPNAAGSCDPGNPCSECAAPDTPIATPSGERAIASLREGDLVYSVVDNAIRPVPVIRVNRTRVVNHHVVHDAPEQPRRFRLQHTERDPDEYVPDGPDGIRVQSAGWEL